MASYAERMRIHGILMLLGWGFFIPVGMFVRSHSKRSWNHEKFGVHFHMVMAAIGMALALAGFGYGIKNYRTLEQKGVGEHTDKYEYAHAVIGTISIAGMILQPLLMAIMRKPKDEAEHHDFANWPKWRQVGHVGHRACGFISFYLAFVAMIMGTNISESRAQKWTAAFIATLTATILVTLTIVRLSINKYDVVVPLQDVHNHDVKVELGEASDHKKETPFGEV